jgi:hypothetical protein
MQKVIDNCLKIGDEISDANSLIKEITNIITTNKVVYYIYMIDEQGDWWFMDKTDSETKAVESMNDSKPTYEHRKFVITRERKTTEILDYDNYYGTNVDCEAEE